MPRPINSSSHVRSLIEVLLSDREAWRYGYDLSKETAMKSGTLYPILMRLEGQGWLETRWEESTMQGRPSRHMYRLTATGASEGRALLETSQVESSRARLVTGEAATG